MNTVLTFLRDHRERLALERRGVPPQLTAALLTPRFQTSRHVIVLILPVGRAEPVLVAKVPRLAGDSAALAHEAEILRALQEDGDGSIPQVVAFEEVSGFPLLIETALVGSSLDRAAVRRDPSRSVELGLQWLLRMEPIGAGDWARIGLIPLTVVIAVELDKWLRRRYLRAA